MKFKQYVTQNDIKFMIRTSLVGLLLSIVSAEMLLASGAYGQLLNKKITVSFSESTIPAAFERLESQNIHIAFDAAKYNLAKKKVNAKIFKSNSVRDVMRYLLRETDLMAHDNGVYITLIEKPVQQNGYISGKVIDDRGQPLANASIKLIGANKSTQSGIDGSYLLNAAPGTYMLEVSYLSYQTQRVEGVKIQGGQRTGLNIAMKTQVNALETAIVSVSFKKASVAGLYAAQKNAASVTDGISAEQIARTPDNDMGQVLKRVTGLTTVNNRNVIVRGMSDRYNQAMLDGVVIPSTSQNRRDFSFDIIPTEMVSSVVVNKTATPDVSAEFSGGQVSVNTIDIPEENFTTIQIGSGSNSQTLGKDFYRLGERHTSEYFGFFDKSSKMPDGIRTWQWNSRSLLLDAPPGYILTDEELNNTPLNPTEFGDAVKYNDLDAIAQSKRFNSDAMKQYKYKAYTNQNMRLSLGRLYQLNNGNRFGFAASVNFRNEQNIVAFNNTRGSALIGAHYIDSTGIGDNGAGTSYRFNSNAGLVANMGYQADGFKVSLRNIYARTYANNYNESIRKVYTDPDPKANRLTYQLPEAMSLQQHQLIGEYQLPWQVKAEGMFTINKIKQQILDERKLSYRITTTIDDQPYFQTPNLLTTAGFSNKGAVTDWRMWTSIDETDYNWSAAFSRKFQRGTGVSTLVKLGYQAWTKKRALDLFKFLPMTRSTLVGNVSIPAPPIESSYDRLFSNENIGNGDGQAYYYAEGLGGRYYNGEMSSHALFLMADQRLWQKLRLVYGVRAEYFDLNSRQEELYKRKYQKGDTNGAEAYELGVKENNWRFLPSINATFSLTNTFNIRGSYARTVIRPDFREVGMFAMYDFELDGYVSGEQVQSTVIDNLDMRFEWYPSSGEIISLTGYYKYLDKPIELVHRGDDKRNYTFANMESARNLGLELEIRKNFAFIGDEEWLKDLFISANGTLLKSKVNVLSHWETIDGATPDGPKRRQSRYPGQDRPLMGQSPWLLNLGVGYWGDNFGITTSYNHRGYRTNIGNFNLSAVEYELAPKQLDAQFYARFLNKKMEVKLNLANLLDDWTRYYENTEGFTTANDPQTGNYVTTKVKGDNKYNKADGDIITYRKKDGRRFNLSVTYNF